MNTEATELNGNTEVTEWNEDAEKAKRGITTDYTDFTDRKIKIRKLGPRRSGREERGTEAIRSLSSHGNLLCRLWSQTAC